jgi:16S rRNA (cytidine1402-2'-O)-methyltransferase
MENGNLFIVATPIGNLKDITLRAIEILEKVEYVACEDTRKTGQLLRSLSLENKPMLISYYEGTEMIRIPNIINLLLNGKDVALVSDGGTPLISDPGYPLVRECLKRNLKVFSVPGPSALVSALVSSGQPPDKFIYLGFLPKKEGNRLRILSEVKEANKNLEASVILYEAPHRLIKTLEDIQDVFGDIKISLLRELTKIYEEQEYKSVSEFLIDFGSKKPKGEYVIIFNPKMY